ncbi:Uma2 family endonuclease [Streptomyces sp. NPDC020965]|uniref:Uma2 family endonuclease n=1 Tax=Streptomyces sp. NPDC020965 TaxID=3365105 RepID=UPI0037B7D8C6
MTAALVEPMLSEEDVPPEEKPSWEYLLSAWRELDAPEGWLVEIDEGHIAVVPPPHAHHNHIAAKVQRALYRSLSEELEIYQTLGIHITPLDRLYVPDLVVVPSELVSSAAPDSTDPVDAAEALLVAEITSRGNAKDDRDKKLRAYATAPVAIYLLIDRFDPHGPTTTLFSDPRKGAYASSLRVPFGEPIQLPEPFDVKLDTSAFPV